MLLVLISVGVSIYKAAREARHQEEDLLAWAGTPAYSGVVRPSRSRASASEPSHPVQPSRRDTSCHWQTGLRIWCTRPEQTRCSRNRRKRRTVVRHMRHRLLY